MFQFGIGEEAFFGLNPRPFQGEAASVKAKIRE